MSLVNSEIGDVPLFNGDDSARASRAPERTSSDMTRSAELGARAGVRGASLNLGRLDLISLRLVVLCDETRSLSAAAIRAHLSLSGASHRLSSLESSLGVELFARHRRGLQTTTEGEAVASYARLILSLLDDMRASLGKLRSDEGSPARPWHQNRGASA